MLTAKRVIITTVCGLIFGFICMTMAGSNPAAPIPGTMKLTIFLSRAIMCFMIGISALRMPWWAHGIALGFIGSIPMAIPVSERMDIFIGTFVMGIIYGFLTELITSVLFKAKPTGTLVK